MASTSKMYFSIETDGASFSGINLEIRAVIISNEEGKSFGISDFGLEIEEADSCTEWESSTDTDGICSDEVNNSYVDNVFDEMDITQFENRDDAVLFCYWFCGDDGWEYSDTSACDWYDVCYYM